jgi:hypothetical protein
MPILTGHLNEHPIAGSGPQNKRDVKLTIIIIME